MRKLIFILTSIVLLAVGCERKFLIEPGHHHGNEIYLEIDLDEPLDEEVRTKDNPEMYKELLSTARSITVIAYPVDEHGYYGVHKIDSLAGSIWLMPGKYDLMIYTSDFFDLDGTFYRGTTDPEAMEAFTNQVKSSKTKYNNIETYDMDEPDPLFVCYYKNFEVKDDTHSLKTGLQPMIYKYWYEVNVEGLDYITSAWFEIDGMYTSVFMKDGTHKEDEYGNMRVESKMLKDENKIEGEFFSFGPHQDSSVENSIVLTFINGRTIRVPMNDISPSVKELRKGGVINITQKIIINIGDTGSGFTPEVKDWEEEEVVIPI